MAGAGVGLRPVASSTPRVHSPRDCGTIACKILIREAHYSLGVCYRFYVPDLPKALEHYRTFLALGDSDMRVQQLIEQSKRH